MFDLDLFQRLCRYTLRNNLIPIIKLTRSSRRFSCQRHKEKELDLFESYPGHNLD